MGTKTTIDARIPPLLNLQAPVRFLSCAPLMGPITGDRTGMHGVIGGGETGPQARPMHPAWGPSLLEHRPASEACVFFKPWGEWRASGAIGALHDAHPDWRGDGTALPLQEWFGAHGVRVGRRPAGRHVVGRAWNEVPLPLDIVVASSAS